MRRLLAAILVLGLFASPWHLLALRAQTRAGEKPARKIILDRWEAAYLQSGRAGHVHTYSEQFEHDGQKLIRTNVEWRLQIKRFKEVTELAMDDGDLTTADGKVVATFLRHYLAKTKQVEITGVVDGNKLRLTRDNKMPLKPAPWKDEVLGRHAQQTVLKDRQVKPGDKFTIAAFEPTVNLVLTQEIQVKDYEDVDVPGAKKKQRLLRVEWRPEPLKGVQLPPLIVWVDKEFEPIVKETELPIGKLRMVRTTKAAALTPGAVAQLTDLGLSQLIRIKRSIPDPYDTRSAVYRIEIRDDADPGSAFAKDRRQQIKNVKDNTFELHITNDAPAGKAVERPGDEYTESSYFITSADARVRTLAATAVGRETDPWKKALSIERWVRKHMRVTSEEALATADHVAKTLRGDCTEFAMLTAAMCRAQGIPSRTAVGLIYADGVGQPPSFAFHMWTEVWIDGHWRSLDATLGRGRIGATHLKICDQSWHEASDMTPLFPVVRVLGRIRIDVVSVE